MRNDFATIVNGSLVGRFRASRLPWMFLILGTVYLALGAMPVAAAPVAVPTAVDGVVGAKFRLLFRSGQTRDAASSDIEVYNTWIHAQAMAVPELAALYTRPDVVVDGNWKVIGSTDDVDAIDNTDMTGTGLNIPIYFTNDTRVVPNYEVFWAGQFGGANDIDNVHGGNRANIVINEFGDVQIGPDAISTTWTGTDVGGRQNRVTTKSPLGDATEPDGSLSHRTGIGIAGGVGSTWLFSTYSNPNTNLWPMYGLSGVIEVVPEPSSLILISIGAFVGLVGTRRRKKANAS
jgi:hypothetical protein